MYRGRFRLGDWLLLALPVCRGGAIPNSLYEPLRLPIVEVFDGAGAKQFSSLMPVVDVPFQGGTYLFMLPFLIGSLTTGLCTIVYLWPTSGLLQTGRIDTFDLIDGGTVLGNVLTMYPRISPVPTILRHLELGSVLAYPNMGL